MTKTITRNELVFQCPGSVTPAMGPSAVIASSSDSGVERKVPLFIPAEEAHYWSSAWQQDVAESMKALREGDFEDFEDFDSDDPTDVARWLLNVDEDDCD
jgi:hypothetical protein